MNECSQLLSYPTTCRWIVIEHEDEKQRLNSPTINLKISFQVGILSGW